MTVSSFVKINHSFLEIAASSLEMIMPPQHSSGHCALLFFGLPRSYETIVLPSIVRHVLKPNQHCDVYAHSVIREEEDPGRSGKGGTIDPNALFLLKDQVFNTSHVAIVTDTEEDFWYKYNDTLHKYRTKRGKDGKLIYYPWKLKEYKPQTVDNIIKQWYSIESVWNLMEQEAKKLNKTYETVGMFRSDVFFATPIRVSQRKSREAVMAGFALYPVNDRMIYGPYDAIKIWATRRFERFENEIDKMPPGQALHSETILDRIIFPAMQRATSVQVTSNANICFFRVRADESMWVNDCLRARTPGAGTLRNPKWVGRQKKMVETILGRSCKIRPLTRLINQLLCPTTNTTA